MNSPQTQSAPHNPLALIAAKSASGCLSPDFLHELAARFAVTAFVETGTYLGDTTATARTVFPEVHTIELSEQLAARARVRFANDPGVHVYQGDSSGVLADILRGLTGPTVFWLDGHYSEGVTARGRSNTPILDEIALIRQSGRKDAIILIDDLRLFDRGAGRVSAESSMSGYPSLNEVHRAILAIDSGYQFFVLGDVALAFPEATGCTVSAIIQAMTISRLFDGENLPIDEVMAAEGAIGQATGRERDVIRNLPSMAQSCESLGFGLHYRMWCAITLLAENRIGEACAHYREVIRCGFPHWRCHWYLAVALHVAGDNDAAHEILTAFVEAIPSFTPAKQLLSSLTATQAVPTAANDYDRPSAENRNERPRLRPGCNFARALRDLGLWRDGRPLRLHLGCGEMHFDGYVNVDYPPSEHSCQSIIGADVFADITRIRWPDSAVDEIRMHHVFEHFKRAEALALLIIWHEALQVGGKLHLETPDVEGCAQQLASNLPFAMKQAVLRHCFGSQEAGWAYHYDGWYEEKYRHVLGRLGFDAQTSSCRWPHPPHLANVTVVAMKRRAMTRDELLQAADGILAEYMVAAVPSERQMHQVWCKALRDALEKFTAPAEQSKPPRVAPPPVPTATGSDGFDDDNPRSNGEHWVIQSQIRPGDVVFDVGANVGDWSRTVIGCHSGITLHAFEPAPETFATLQRNLQGTSAHLHAHAIGRTAGELPLFCFAGHPDLAGMNSFYQRHEVEQNLGLQTTTTVVKTQSLDEFIATNRIPHVDFLKVDTEGAELDVLVGAASSLAAGKIKLIQFEYGGTYRDAGITLRQAYHHLTQFGYQLYRISPGRLIKVEAWEDGLENYRYANYLAVAPSSSDDRDAEPAKAGKTTAGGVEGASTLVGLVFSKDRALQLDATLHSFFACCEDAASVMMKVLYRASDARHEKQYRDLAWAHPTVEFVAEKSFRADCLRMLNGCSQVLFLVDDAVFVRPFRMADASAALARDDRAIGVSLRLGANTTFCYPVNKPQRVPVFGATAEGLRSFNWTIADLDFAYPLEVSSSLYRGPETIRVLQALEFRNPNELEARFSELARGMAVSHPTLLCFAQSVAFCAPLNKVQTVAVANRCGAQARFTTDSLARQFADGIRVDTAALRGFVPHGCHQEIELPLRSIGATRAPVASVIINCHNYAAHLEGAVAAVLAQTFRDFEIVIIDDGSTDDSVPVARRIMAQHRDDVAIRLIRLADVGPSAARRHGIEQSRGRYFVPLDADDRIAPTFLEQTVPILEDNSKLGFAYVDTVYFGDREQRHHQPEYDFDRLCAANFISYCSLVRRAAFDAVDGYDRANWGYYEDWDLWIRMGEAGWYGRHVPEPLFFYHQHFSSSLSFFSRRLDPIYRANIICRHASRYPDAVVAQAGALLREMPLGWHAAPPLRDVARIRDVLTRHPGNRHVRYFLAIAQFRSGDGAAAIATLKTLVAEFPGDQLAHATLEEFSAQAAPAPARIAGSPRDGLSAGAADPIVSVIVPCYNQAEFLPEAVSSVIAQTFTNWEIIIVNDGSPDGTSRAARDLIRAHPDRRIRLVEKENGGLADARNAGIQFARGRYLLPLDADDRIHPEMLAKTVALLETDASVAIAYCDWQYFGAEHRMRCALDYDFERLCNRENLFTCTSLFRKEAWVAVGGYNRNMTHGVEDWDFWIGCGEKGYIGRRIPEVLFFYRAKSGSMIHTLQPHLKAMFARIVLNHPAIYGAATVEKARAVFAAAQLPPPKPAQAGTEWVASPESEEPSPARSSEAVASRIEPFQRSVNAAQRAISERALAQAIVHLEEALTLAPTEAAAAQTREFIGQVRALEAKTGGQPLVAPRAPVDEREDVASLIDAYRHNRADADAISKLQQYQQKYAAAVKGTDPRHLESIFRGEMGKTYRSILECGLNAETLGGAEPERSRGSTFSTLLGEMLLRPAHRTSCAIAFEAVPSWFLEDYLHYLTRSPEILTHAGEADQYLQHLKRLFATVQEAIAARPQERTTLLIATHVATRANLIPVYCSASSTRELMQARSAVLAYVLKRNGASLDAQLAKKPKLNSRLRVGFLNFHFGPQTETHVTLPALQLDRSKFEVQLFALRPNPGDVENRCRSFADRFVVLGEALDAQVKTIREAGLDALVIGTNVTAVTNQITVLAMHRLAPVQLVSYCSPMSTGIPNVDGYLFGSLSEAKEIAADFSERLVTLDGPPGCLDYTNEAPAQARFSRADFGIEATAPVYVNAAACYKITPETVAAWGQILQQVPQSRLLLLPFNPNWSKSAPTGRFTRMLYAELAKHGVTAERVVIGNALPSRADVKEFEKLGNIYLDTFPFSGSLSVIDPLELGLPTVVVDGTTARGRAAAALLRDIAMPELICPDVSTYISTAVRLGTDAGHRAAVVAKLTRQMQSNPRFLDPAGYARRLGDQLTALVHGRKAARPAARRALAA